MAARKLHSDFGEKHLIVGPGADLEGKVCKFEHAREDWRLTEPCHLQKSPAMRTRPTRQSPSLGRFGRIALISCGALAALLMVGYFAGKAWVESYLRSEAFRTFVNAKVGTTLRGEAEFAPFTFTGLNVYSDGVRALGYEDAPFAEVKIDQLHAQLSLRRFFEKVWQIEEVEAQRLTLRLDGTRLTRPATIPAPTVAAAPTESRKTKGSGWLPNRVEVGSAIVKELNVEWGDVPSKAGGLHGLSLRATPAAGGWDLDGHGGTIVTAGLPTLDISSISVRQRDRALFISAADFTQSGGGTLHANGEVLFDDHLDLRAQLNGVDLGPFLTNDWRMKMHGQLAGEIRIRSPLPARDGLVVSGDVRVLGGQFEALPVLDEIAVFTRTQQFRRVTLTNASASFTRDAKQLRVTNLIAESQGLIRIEGAFNVANNNVDGLFQVGVTPTSLQWLPGSQERVFTESRGGYLWTPMRLTGPVDSPKEDLSGRLVTAAGNAVVDKAESVARDAIKATKEATRSALDYLFPKK